MNIYLDNDYRCYVEDIGEARVIETDSFNDRCKAWIESMRFVPDGEEWIRSDGEVFRGEMIAPWKDLAPAFAAQETYESMLAEFGTSYEEGVNAI